MARFLEFGFCGIDHSVRPEILQKVFAPLEHARLAAAFQLAYQGYPWKPTPEYEKDAPRDKRRYGGLVYPAWSEIDDYVKNQLPKGTALSFHLNETPACPYVSGLLRGDADVHRLVDELANTYNARHIQVNLTAHGLDIAPFSGEDDARARVTAAVLRDLCARYPDTIFVIPIAKIKRDGAVVCDTLDFFKRLLASPAPGNLCGFFDASAGTGTEPDAAPEIPDGYPKQRIGFTGGIRPDNVKLWLDRYAARAREHGCSLLSDAQTGFRIERKRGEAVDNDALEALSNAVREWVTESSKEQALPLSVGILTLGGVFRRMIPRNSMLPTRKSIIFSTSQDNQTHISFKVFQGEREMAADNKLVGQFDVTDIPPAPRGMPKIEVSFDVDASGTLAVSADAMWMGKKQCKTMSVNAGLPGAEVESILQEAERMRASDGKKRDLVQAKNSAAAFCQQVERQLSELKGKAAAAGVGELEGMVKDLRASLDSDAADAREINGKRKALEEASWKVSQ